MAIRIRQPNKEKKESCVITSQCFLITQYWTVAFNFRLSTRICYHIILHMSFSSYSDEQLDHTKVKSNLTSRLSSPADDSFTRVENIHHIETYANRFVTFSYCFFLSSGLNEYFFDFTISIWIYVSLQRHEKRILPSNYCFWIDRFAHDIINNKMKQNRSFYWNLFFYLFLSYTLCSLNELLFSVSFICTFILWVIKCVIWSWLKSIWLEYYIA